MQISASESWAVCDFSKADRIYCDSHSGVGPAESGTVVRWAVEALCPEMSCPRAQMQKHPLVYGENNCFTSVMVLLKLTFLYCCVLWFNYHVWYHWKCAESDSRFSPSSSVSFTTWILSYLLWHLKLLQPSLLPVSKSVLHPSAYFNERCKKWKSFKTSVKYSWNWPVLNMVQGRADDVAAA